MKPIQGQTRQALTGRQRAPLLASLRWRAPLHRVEEASRQSPSLRQPAARCLLVAAVIPKTPALPCPGSLDQHVFPGDTSFQPWRRVRSESRRRLIWRCSGKWLACPRIGNASTATSAARLMSTWQWAPSSVPPAPGSCECLWVDGCFLMLPVPTWWRRHAAVGCAPLRPSADLSAPLARRLT